MNYDYGFFGMHMLWWLFLIVLISILFGLFEPVPKRRIRKDSPLDILQRRSLRAKLLLKNIRRKRMFWPVIWPIGKLKGDKNEKTNVSDMDGPRGGTCRRREP